VKRASKHRDCPLYCRYCGARLKRDHVSCYCPTANCQWYLGASTCQIEEGE